MSNAGKRQMKFTSGLRKEWSKSNPRHKQGQNQIIRSRLKRIKIKEIKFEMEGIQRKSISDRFIDYKGEYEKIDIDFGEPQGNEII